MTNICHVFDDSAAWEQRLGITHLLSRLPSDVYQANLAAIGASARIVLKSLRRPVKQLPACRDISLFAAPVFSRWLTRKRVHLVHAWGVQAAVAARAASLVPLILHIFDPTCAARHVRLIRILASAGPMGVICSCGIVRRRLIEGGVDPSLLAVIRPAVDFSEINRVRRSQLRQRLSVDRDAFIVMLPDPVTRDGGHFEAFWAVAARHRRTDRLRVIVPGTSLEKSRIKRFTPMLPGGDPSLAAPPNVPFEHLLTVSDALLITPRGDISTTSIAWAMAAGVPVIGTAVHSVAELIANKTNGLLFKQVKGRSMTPGILRLLDDRASQQHVKETARAQAYEVFSLRRYADQCQVVYTNLLEAKPAATGIVDAATAG